MRFEARRNLLCLCGLILVFVNVCKAVKITKISVPPRYELKDDAEQLILDCDFTVNASDTGFVFKWLHNGVSIYQWIPSKKSPFALGAFKDRIDINYTTSDDRYRKHSALVITKPSVSDSGNYTCNVQTFQGSDKQSAELQIIDPADKVELTYSIDPKTETVNLVCSVQNIFPLPEVKILFNDKEQEHANVTNSKVDEEDLYDVEVLLNLKKTEIEDESEVTCLVNIPNSDYTKRETITYDENNGRQLAASLGMLLLPVLVVQVAPRT